MLVPGEPVLQMLLVLAELDIGNADLLKPQFCSPEPNLLNQLVQVNGGNRATGIRHAVDGQSSGGRTVDWRSDKQGLAL